MILKSIFCNIYSCLLSLYYKYCGSYVKYICIIEDNNKYTISWYYYILIKILYKIGLPLDNKKNKYYVEILHNNKIIKNIYGNASWFNVIQKINTINNLKKFNKNIIMKISICNGKNNISIKHILDEYKEYNIVRDILDYEKIEYDDDSHIEIDYIKFPKKTKYRVNLISVYDKNIVDLYNIDQHICLENHTQR